jgi:capping protein beta
LEGATFPSDKLREMEVFANRVFDRYRDAYYGVGSVSSAYLWDLPGDDDESSGWAACVLMYKRE